MDVASYSGMAWLIGTPSVLTVGSWPRPKMPLNGDEKCMSSSWRWGIWLRSLLILSKPLFNLVSMGQGFSTSCLQESVS